MQNTLYYGDNLKVLREHIPSEIIALIYPDLPPTLQNALAFKRAGKVKGEVGKKQCGLGI